MGKSALDVVRAAKYTNAGTVEFLVDRNREFYFLEMNTRLQVEHAISEMVTGFDLVKEQIRVAAGERLGFSQSDVAMQGAAIECRVYAEDPDNNFFPSPGTIRTLQTPSGPGIRDDSGVYEGWTVPIDYDPLISKLVAWAPTRNEAIDRMQRALREYRVEGIKTNIRFFMEVLDDPEFRNGEFDTSFIEKWRARRIPPAPPSQIEKDLAMLSALLADFDRARPAVERTGTADISPESLWKRTGRQRSLRH
jgi:acetyl-CoA carboxylase biotin carboxylase subunit